MNDYTPTPEQVRDNYVEGMCAFYGARGEEDYRSQFDRWLAEHDRATAERAWDELFVTQFDGAPFEMSDTSGIRDPNNPYREVSS